MDENLTAYGLELGTCPSSAVVRYFECMFKFSSEQLKGIDCEYEIYLKYAISEWSGSFR